MKHPKPEPVIVTTVCSLCGENWTSHGEDPSTLDCIRLLKAKVARLPYTINRPYVAPMRPAWPTYPLITYGTSAPNMASNTTATNVVYMTPRTDDGPDLVGATA